jgi:NitT/TauT family transport system ATP-binding protein
MGLLEVLENEGSLELFELTRHVNLELTQVLLVVKAAEILGWVTTPGGKVEMTPEGRGFLAADVGTRKRLLNEKLRGLFVFDLIVRMLEKSPTGEVEDAVVLSQIALMFPHEKPQRVLRTIVAWARFAALFQYSGTRRVFHGLEGRGR